MANAYSPLAVANEFIALGIAEGKPIEHMKAQKLVHFAHGFSLARDTPILNECPQVWKFGPVFSTLYQDLRARPEMS
ncbi:hypothetical protein G5B40_01095 [Pikeienuella piscinae]|uniref:Antitoxin SocA-like Panacea domain-containing protein n=1 Tax=Pikeienuella piscinae TaxID=2748098 RepID=A0A7L5BTN9_9RHOB|nr:hypothetical protein [Pikeienuella piscinae]QIE54163.1 hypothetical protein G5B40_01095 [Pikeienuella piscinae]